MKKALSLILAIALCLTGCGGSMGVGGTSAHNNTVTDGSGAVLPIPQSPQETTIASVYAVAAPFIVALGLSERVLAINVKSRFWTDNDPHLAAAGTVGRGAVDLEKLAALAPSVLIHRSNDPKTVEAVQGKLNIPVLCITVESYADIHATLTMLGAYFGAQARAAEVQQWMDKKFAMIDERVATIPENERVSALVLGGELGKVAGSDMLQCWMIEKAGGKSVCDASDSRSWINVGVETIFAWNPDFLFCTSSTALDYSVDALLQDKTWAAMKAVQNQDVFVIPAKIDTWDMPGVSCVLGTMFMLHRMYPSRLSAKELQMEIDEYYQFMFGKSFDDAYLGYTLEP